MVNIKLLTKSWIGLRQRKRGLFVILIISILNCYVFIVKNELAAQEDEKSSFRDTNSTLSFSSVKRKHVRQFSKTFVQDVVKRLEGRSHRLKQKCQKLRHDKGFNIFNPNIENRLKYNKKYDLLCCQNNQNGAATLIRHIDAINSANRDFQTKQLIKVKSVKSKVLVVGNPLERLVQSFHHFYGHSIFHQDKMRFLNYMVGGKNPSGFQNETEKLRASFSYFLLFVLNKNHSGEAKFMSTTGFCSPCYINYKYIIRKETFTEDLFSLFNHLNVTEISSEELEESVDKFNSQKGEDYLEYFKGLEGSLLKKVFLYVREDLYLFEYDIPDIFIKHLDYHDLI